MFYVKEENNYLYSCKGIVADNISPSYYIQNTESVDNIRPTYIQNTESTDSISPSNVQNTKEERSTSFNLSREWSSVSNLCTNSLYFSYDYW